MRYDIKTYANEREAETIRNLSEAQKIVLIQILERHGIQYLVKILG